jgi:hypothetical protein
MNNQYIPVEGYSSLVRDRETGVVLNTNIDEIEAAKERKRIKREKIQKEKDLDNKITSLESDVVDIKKMLMMIMEKL